ncbi:MAG: hypothetical protein IPK17_38565 [Chloroflexi bacterium]|nr:hypothetical protein [Chloroflexota bacterium]
MHGGKTPTGIASPHFKTGRHSKHLPARMLERYEEALSDGELLALNAEIALLDARIADLLARVDTGESGAAWTAAGKAYHDLKNAMGKIDIPAAQDAMQQLETALGDGSTDYTAWNEIQMLVQQRRTLVETERKRVLEMEQMITVEQGMILIGTLLGIIKARVRDPAVLAAIQTDVNGVLAQRAGHRLESANG